MVSVWVLLPRLLFIAVSLSAVQSFALSARSSGVLHRAVRYKQTAPRLSPRASAARSRDFLALSACACEKNTATSSSSISFPAVHTPQRSLSSSLSSALRGGFFVALTVGLCLALRRLTRPPFERKQNDRETAACPYCAASGRVPCAACLSSSSPSHHCAVCDGSGSLCCINCGGSGKRREVHV